MSAYVIASYDITNPEHYQQYVQNVGPLVGRHNGELLVAESSPEGLEGETRQVYVVIRFDSDEAARNWYNDPDYAPVRQIRFDSTANGNLVIAKQFVPPGG